MILGNLAQYKYDTNERMSECSWIILQCGVQFYLKNPCICFVDVTYFENGMYCKYCQTENSQSKQKLTILGNAEPKFLNVNKN